LDFGILLGDSLSSTSPVEELDTILRQVEAAQRAGMTYIVVGQHFLFPTARWLQPVPLLARLAAELDAGTRLGTHVLIAPLYHPVMLAEELATLDILTEGRLCAGFGLGYMRTEFKAFGIPYEERVSRFEEGIELIKRLWTEDRVTHDGPHYVLDDVTVQTRPLQTPRPTIWLGAQSVTGVRRAARLGDAWSVTALLSPDDLAERFGVFAAERERLQLPLNRSLLRREVFVGRDREDATATAMRMVRIWYEQMAAVGAREFDPQQVSAELLAMVEHSFVVGSAAECAAELRALGERVPVSPIVVRANWPGIARDEILGYIASLGEELIPSLRDFEVTSSVAA
jgi:alkanesulfonate monooxygenase SsuD/methylene tetrahydromethanopterin reductase-like flavin-dependent oxidoreductase (luciferase family)